MITQDQSDMIEHQIAKFIRSFPEGSLGRILASFCPVPSTGKLEDKFEYFYRPYSYVCNTQKYITYEGVGSKGERDPYELYEELLKTEHFIDTYLRSRGKNTRKTDKQFEMQLQTLIFEIELENKFAIEVGGGIEKSLEAQKKQ